MTRRAFTRQPFVPLAPAHRRLCDWLEVNRGFYGGFRDWLHATGYGPSALNIYGVAARLAISLLDKPYWTIDPDADLRTVREYILETYPSEGTVQSYFKGLAKFEHYLRLRCHLPAPPKGINWAHYLGALPAWVAEHTRLYLTHRQRSWRPERQRQATHDALSQITRPLRWMAAQAPFEGVSDITPARWFAYVDARLADGLSPVTVNDELHVLQSWLRFLAEQALPVCERMLRVQPLAEPKRLPRDVAVEQLRSLQGAIQSLANSSHAFLRRLGMMDLAWFLLMVHSGLRTCEVRSLKLSDIDWENRRVRIEQSKGLKDRLVPLSPATLDALRAYLAVRGAREALPEAAFIFRHLPLSPSYCSQRLWKTYAKRCGVRATPHQLRHSCATLLLNAGAPVLTVRAILGHQHIDTTLGYARLYDGTVAADYYRAMRQIERRMSLPEDAPAQPPSPGELLALVDALRTGTLNEQQTEIVGALRSGIAALAEQVTPTD